MLSSVVYDHTRALTLILCLGEVVNLSEVLNGKNEGVRQSLFPGERKKPYSMWALDDQLIKLSVTSDQFCDLGIIIFFVWHF